MPARLLVWLLVLYLNSYGHDLTLHSLLYLLDLSPSLSRHAHHRVKALGQHARRTPQAVAADG
jgi:hypothetical protein